MAKAGAGNKGAAVATSEPDDPRTQRSRWATRKLTQKSSGVKRLSIMDRIGHKRTPSTEKKRQSGGTNSLPPGDDDTPDDEDDDQNSPPADAGSATSGDEDDGRVLYFNLPLPDEFKDEDGHPKQHYTRNKIRTAKYTPLSFIPKNLWFQFHNIANIFFLFLVILVVRLPMPVLDFSFPGLAPHVGHPELGMPSLATESVRPSHSNQELDFPHLWRRESWPQRSAPDLHYRRDCRQRRG